jgi:hypothetical protein
MGFPEAIQGHLAAKKIPLSHKIKVHYPIKQMQHGPNSG